jgi:IS30 family transposase
MLPVDQLESSAAGFTSQLNGRLTRKRYKAATVFVDHFSRMNYVNLQEGPTSADTVEAKKAFESYPRNMGVRIQHYNADNGRFADNGFVNAVKKQRQIIYLCSVNAHFQNGVAEKRI